MGALDGPTAGVEVQKEKKRREIRQEYEMEPSRATMEKECVSSGGGGRSLYKNPAHCIQLEKSTYGRRKSILGQRIKINTF